MTMIRTHSQADFFFLFDAMQKCEKIRIASLFFVKKPEKNHRSIALSHSHRITSPGTVPNICLHAFQQQK
jgi:hypothetical protein